jgi:hypothetical protein
MTEGFFGSPIEALVAGYDYDRLFSSGTPGDYVLAALKWSVTVPGLSTMTKPFYEGANTILGKLVDVDQLAQLARVVIEELKFRDRTLEHFRLDMQKFEAFVAETQGALLLRQAVEAAQRTADSAKIARIGYILLNGALRWPEDENRQQLIQMEMAEFTRIAEILTDSDVIVLRSIYDLQEPLIEKYREIIQRIDAGQSGASESEWIQSVFLIWKDTKFLFAGQPISFLNVHSALIRLESQGLIGRATSQTVVAQITSTPYGLLELGALFVEYATGHGSLLSDSEK